MPYYAENGMPALLWVVFWSSLMAGAACWVEEPRRRNAAAADEGGPDQPAV